MIGDRVTPADIHKGWTAETRQQARLQNFLADYFSEEELKDISFDLGIDYESLPAQGKAGKARVLISRIARTGDLSALVEQCHRLRPNRHGELAEAEVGVRGNPWI
jgi:hypothetical protein